MAMKASKTAATRIAPRACGVSRFCRSAGSGSKRFQTPFSSCADGVAQRAAPARGLAELDGQPAEHRLGLDVARASGAISLSSTSGIVKCCSSATMSAKASWNASTSALVGSLKRRCMPSRIACVVSWAMMSCERQV